MKKIITIKIEVDTKHPARKEWNMLKDINPCPEFPYWGASYPDACCIKGKLYDLDRCDENGNLYEPIDDIPCPFCQTEDFIELDPFSKEDEICEELMEDDSAEQYDIHIDEAKEKARKWYLNWVGEMRDKY